jgi:hypothetical protein
VALAVAAGAPAFSAGSGPSGSGTAVVQPPEPVVAIHVSERTEALETVPATGATPSGPGTSGKQWWYTSWKYFVAYESLKEALSADGTPFVTVSDADIAGGALLRADGSPRYPILFSLNAEAVGDDQIAPLRAYVDAGGFAFVGGASFTRRPDGTARGDFALAGEMGVHTTGATLDGWYLNATFTKAQDHRLVSHIPSGALRWHMPGGSDETPWGTAASGYPAHISHYVWRVTSADADVLANGGGGPLLATKGYGKGRFIYDGDINPLIGHGGYDSGMYSYVILRRAIEWAFEASNLPLVKLAPWQYPYDAAFVFRHDWENYAGNMLNQIIPSAKFDAEHGVKGDYWFATGILRAGSPDTQLTDEQKAQAIANLRTAIQDYGATIGPHNGGLANPNLPAGYAPNNYWYWHWGPDEALDTSPVGYASGFEYAKESLTTAFNEIDGWTAGVDNGRPGCGAAGTCPRVWVSPFFNSPREGSYKILDDLGVIAAGEQKLSPFALDGVDPDAGQALPHGPVADVGLVRQRRGGAIDGGPQLGDRQGGGGLLLRARGAHQRLHARRVPQRRAA